MKNSNPQKNNPKELVSAIIPTYNRCEFVQKAIDSALEQNYKNIEVIVIDDGSTDGSGAILKERYGEKIQYFYQQNKGESFARNFGVSVAKGDFLTFLDSDDVWFPTKLAKQMAILNNCPSVVAVYNNVVRIDENGNHIGGSSDGMHRKDLDFELETMIIRNRIPGGPSSCLIRREVYERLGGFSNDIQFGEDWELWLKIIANYPIFFVQEPLSAYRQHFHTQSAIPDIIQVESRLKDYLKFLKRFANTYPDKVPKALLNKSLAYQYLTASLASYYLGFADKGKHCLAQAVEYDPTTWLSRKNLTHHIHMFVSGHFRNVDNKITANPIENFRVTIVNSLPEALNKQRIKNSINGILKVHEGFSLNKQGWIKSGAKAVFVGLCYDPSLLNLSTLAVFSEPIIGKEVVDRLRSLKHGAS
mgnify:CR=1 FL=1